MLIPHGIKIYCSEITDDECNLLLNYYENNKDKLKQIDYIGTSASNVTGHEFKTFNQETIHKHCREYLKDIKEINSLNIISQWINVYDNSGILNIHAHTGNVAYVIYVKVPNDSAKLNFVLDAKKNSLFSDEMAISPKKNMILMFPAEIRHYVSEYYGDEQRISVSGNIDVD
jgi:uncharacterized protein (TIGR02466 family)